MIPTSLPVLFLLAGCWQQELTEKFQRTDEMVDHQRDLIAARDAIVADDLAGARRAGEHLAQEDWFPGVNAEGKAGLDAVRSEAKKLVDAPDLDAAATALVGITPKCAACHRSQAVPPPAAWTGDPTEPLWIGLAFQSEPDWERGLSSVPGLEKGAGWPERRAAMAEALRQK